jgi:undecaprenyl-diphosphatase
MPTAHRQKIHPYRRSVHRRAPGDWVRPPWGRRLAQIADLDYRLLRRVTRTRRASTTFFLKTLCRLHDPDILSMMILAFVLGEGAIYAERITIALVITSFVVVVIKRTVRRARPSNEMQALVPPDQFSFPSGHTAASFAIALSMFGVFPWLVPALLVVAMVVGFARMYLGVHYPIDVMAGAAVGMLVGSVVALI